MIYISHAKGPYSAIVYINGGDVIAENSMGGLIARGEAGTDDLTVANAAIATVPSTGSFDLLFKGDFLFSGALVVTYPDGLSSLIVRGDGGEMTFATGGLAIKCFEQAAAGTSISIRDLNLCGPGYSDGCSAISIHPDSTGTAGIVNIRNIAIKYFAVGIDLGGVAGNIDWTVPYGGKLENISCYYCNIGYKINGAHHELSNCKAYTSQGPNPLAIHLMGTSSTSGFHSLINCDTGNISPGLLIECDRCSVINLYTEPEEGGTAIDIEADANYVLNPYTNGAIKIGATAVAIDNVVVPVYSYPGYIPDIQIGSLAYGTFVDSAASYRANSISVNNGYNGRTFKLLESSSPPNLGIHRVGDVCINIAPGLGKPFGWICTIAGAPGTWKAIGTIPANGSSIGTGLEQTIAHGFGAVPKRVVIVPTVTGAALSNVWADATNIHVTVTKGKAYNWSAEV